MKRNKKASFLWTIAVVVFFGYLMYQSAFAWNEKLVINEEVKSASLANDKTIFLMINDTHYGVQKNGIKKVKESLEMWSFDKKKEKVYVKHPTLLPHDKTQMMVIYDRGYDSFEHHSDVLSLIKFPFEHYYQDNLIFNIQGIGKKGEVYMTYKNKKIQLKPGESYWSFSSDGFKLTKTTIKNYGLYDKKQFTTMQTEEEKALEESGKPRGLDLRSLERKPLEANKSKNESVELKEEIFMEQTNKEKE